MVQSFRNFMLQESRLHEVDKNNNRGVIRSCSCKLALLARLSSVSKTTTVLALYDPSSQHHWISSKLALTLAPTFADKSCIDRIERREFGYPIDKIDLEWTCNGLWPYFLRNTFWVSPDAGFDVLLGHESEENSIPFQVTHLEQALRNGDSGRVQKEGRSISLPRIFEDEQLESAAIQQGIWKGFFVELGNVGRGIKNQKERSTSNPEISKRTDFNTNNTRRENSRLLSYRQRRTPNIGNMATNINDADRSPRTTAVDNFHRSYILAESEMIMDENGQDVHYEMELSDLDSSVRSDDSEGEGEGELTRVPSSITLYSSGPEISPLATLRVDLQSRHLHDISNDTKTKSEAEVSRGSFVSASLGDIETSEALRDIHRQNLFRESRSTFTKTVPKLIDSLLPTVGLAWTYSTQVLFPPGSDRLLAIDRWLRTDSRSERVAVALSDDGVGRVHRETRTYPSHTFGKTLVRHDTALVSRDRDMQLRKAANEYWTWNDEHQEFYHIMSDGTKVWYNFSDGEEPPIVHPTTQPTNLP